MSNCWVALYDRTFAGIYVVCAVLTFTTQEVQIRRLATALTAGGLLASFGVVAIVGYLLAGRSVLGSRLGWTRLTARWIGISIVVGLFLGSAVVLLLRTGSRILPTSAENAIPAITVAPIAEELLFRGVLFSLLGWLFDPLPTRFARIATIFGTALLFACAHEVHSPVRFVTLLLSGCVFGLIRTASDSAASSAVAHAAYNIAVLVIGRHEF